MRSKTAQVLLDSARLVRTLTVERDNALAKVAEAQLKEAAYIRRVQAEKVAVQMHQKGINTDIEFPTLISSLEKAAEEGKLATIEEAVGMVGPDMGFKTASIHDMPMGGAPGTDLERFLLGSIG
ncbi:MAG: hypothetical protein WC372_08480 [Candidatus Neomarinimicrobiota bacterium]|jgi:CheY-specific phosphatase CheX